MKIGLPKEMAMWRDAKLYTGKLPGNVRVVEYDHETLPVKDMCRSGQPPDSSIVKPMSLSPNVVLGLVLHLADTTSSPYVSLWTLYWMNK